MLGDRLDHDAATRGSSWVIGSAAGAHLECGGNAANVNGGEPELFASTGCQNEGVEHEAEARTPPVFLRPSSLLLVFAGGTLGTLLREIATMTVWPAGRFPLAVLLVNLLGAFLLGLLLESLARSGTETPSGLRTRLFLGTGVLGGFTTYSALAEAVAAFVIEGDPAIAALYGLGTVVLGGLATWVGVLVAGRRRGWSSGGGSR